jgi:uncharacterized hydrophobic protein (TIGR00271 family)
MLQLRVSGENSRLSGLGTWLGESGLARNTVLLPAFHGVHHGLLYADVETDAAGDVLNHLHQTGVRPDDIAVLRIEDIGPAIPRGRDTSLVWADMLGLARRNARPLARLVVFMVVAGVIASYGVITVNSTLIVGAMAVSPDTLPLAAACVALVGARWGLALRSFLTLWFGLAITGVTAGLVAGLLRVLGRLPSGFSADAAGLSGLVTIGVGTIGVALAAGVAAMVALETRASSAVGVAISVTTIPAAAYVGVALAVSQNSRAGGALSVLSVNVAMLLVGGTATLAVQRWLTHRRPVRVAPTPTPTTAGEDGA